MDLNDALHTFFDESRGLLVDMEAALIHLEQTPNDPEAINAVFRAAHTIKGAAGMFGLDDIVLFTHHLETLLVLVREGTVPLSSDLIGLLLQSGDHVGHLLDAMAAGGLRSDTLLHTEHQLLAQLQRACGSTNGAIEVASLPKIDFNTPESLNSDELWHLSLRFSPTVMQQGFEPASFIHHLRTLGRIVQISTLTHALPALSEMDPECCYLGFEIRFASHASKSEIEGIFEFVSDDCQLRILPPDSRVEDYLRLIDELPADRMRLGEILRACGALTEQELQRALQEQAETPQEHQPLGAILIEEQAVQPELVQGAIGRQNELRQRQAQEAKLIRVHSDKLDTLINRVAELVIASSAVGVLARHNKDRSMREAASIVSRLTEQVRDGAMMLRMVEIGEIFNRFKRVVRDVSKETGKEIELHIGGAETELDKILVDKIADPLTHLVRNAIDHGIELPAVRLQRGKTAVGRLDLRASHEAGVIVIEMSDDGAGLNRERILAKAVQKGLIAADAEPSDAQIWELIFEPGFSTAEQVSNLSGRGVGMDVVKRNIEALRGSIDIENRPGHGATFRIRLPLTLAIIDGFLMSVSDSNYVVPLDVVIECIHLAPDAKNYVNLRGEVLPLLRLRQHFQLEKRDLRRENVVVVQVGGRKMGLVVDQLKGELQAVIKPLGPLIDGLPGISGSAVLGTGEIALMLDIQELIHQASHTAVDYAKMAITIK
ncbi:chemotaxis protein CheA [Giesbergeria anulus]|uniref:Chemotaxis protein CheA n=1 Tax=Giesbergeria anulus TaxID=180197 RepID=A0A1H9E9C9_9BURK|nr:chemotaxis protein CheA [Giesbergeria anulus]SEQ22384.1 two-component system, chemotaxis family, sensor kinase CheA [Giesbergeria anulus]